MITQNYINYLKSLLATMQSGNSGMISTALLEYKDYAGNIKYCAPKAVVQSFPYNVALSIRLQDTSSAGISFGTGSTAATVNDYKLESQITSKLSFTSAVSSIQELDADGDPSIRFIINLKNADSSSVIISEIGYFQNIPGNGSRSSTTSSGAYVSLIDRTVLQTPITIQSNETKVIEYKLKTIA